MRPDIKRLTAIVIVLLTVVLCGANYVCTARKKAQCSTEGCKFTFCLGPENTLVNAPVNPKTCNGDITITAAAIYWRAEQDGMEYAIQNDAIGTDSADLATGNRSLNNLFDAKYLTPNFTWDLGFKFGASYASSCDGWDIGILWTRFHEGASDHVEAQFEDNATLLPLWSAYQYQSAGDAPVLFASDISTFWKLKLNLIDLDLGRQFWTSKYLSIRPHLGLRVAYLNQDFTITHRGGSWIFPGQNLRFRGIVDLENYYKGVGIRSGLDTVWNFGCGWALYGDFALSMIYGKFNLSHNEFLRNVIAPYPKTRFLETSEHFRASRAIVDLGLGLQWETAFCDCKYRALISIGWEQHAFFHQNQMNKIKRFGGTNGPSVLNTSGENAFDQSRGSLSTYGWTLSGKLSF